MITMAKPKTKATKKPRKYEKEGPPVSLHPLSLEEALGALLQTPPEPDDGDAVEPPTKPADA